MFGCTSHREKKEQDLTLEMANEKRVKWKKATYIFAEDHHPSGALQRLVRDLVGLELKPFQVRERPFAIVSSGGHDDQSINSSDEASVERLSSCPMQRAKN